MKLRIKLCLVTGAIALMFLTACSEQDSSEPIKGRWYTGDQLTLGKQVFTDNCAVCHGKNAESLPDSEKRQSNVHPAPALNGTAHAWHHSLRVLLWTIDEGGAKLGGRMPGFKDILSDAEKTAAIAYFQSYWDDQLYKRWKDNGNLTK